VRSAQCHQRFAIQGVAAEEALTNRDGNFGFFRFYCDLRVGQQVGAGRLRICGNQLLVNFQSFFRLAGLQEKAGKLFFGRYVIRFIERHQFRGLDGRVKVCGVFLNLTCQFESFEVVRVGQQRFANQLIGKRVILVFESVAGGFQAVRFPLKAGKRDRFPRELAQVFVVKLHAGAQLRVS